MTTRLEKNIGTEDVLTLYLSTENAMEAELSFGVSVVPVVTHKPKGAGVRGKNKNSSIQKSEYFEQIHKLNKS